MNKKEEQKDKRLRKTYGIGILCFNNWAKNGCEICGRKTGRLCVDHIHIKGFKKIKDPIIKGKYLRGILCFFCNTALKGFERTKDGKRNRLQLENTYKYFQTYKLKGEIE